MAEPPHHNAKADVPHLKGDWAGEVVISIYKKYSNGKGRMEFSHWLSFMDDLDLVNTHLGPHGKGEENFDPTAVWCQVLKISENAESIGIRTAR